MSKTTASFVGSFFVILPILLSSAYSDALSSPFDDEKPKTFIIHVSKLEKPSIFPSHCDWYTSTLQSLPARLSSSDPRENIIYTYKNVFHGFAARLTPSQASHLRLQPGFLAVLPQEIHQLHTTRTPQFLGLSDNSGLWPDSEYGEDIIIGVFDTGIWPERQSFNDTRITNPVPVRWKGICEPGVDFPNTLCNKKIIGARAYYEGIEGDGLLNESNDLKSPRDTDGHGTHTASTAAGSVVKNAGLFEYGVGEAKGMVTKARIASYKICWSKGCANYQD